MEMNKVVEFGVIYLCFQHASHIVYMHVVGSIVCSLMQSFVGHNSIYFTVILE